MPRNVRVAKTADIPINEAIGISYDGHEIAVFNVNGSYYAIRNVCPHAGGPLDQGFIDNGCVVCPWHGWSFVLNPGEAPNDALIRYPVQIENGDICVELPD